MTMREWIATVDAPAGQEHKATVRSTAPKATAFKFVFVDVKVAYDTVLHPLLLKRCIDKGIGGQLLMALQALYQGATSRVDANGELLSPVRLLRGVLQGNSLSPLLFNIYLDSVIGDLVTAGYPRFVGMWLPTERAAARPESATQEDYCPALFFADDGVLNESDHGELQLMLERLTASLEACGLELSVKKTKWMLVPPVGTTKEKYERMKATALLNPMRIKGQAIELVDNFDYLGVRVWWRWDYTLAWALATQRARKCYFAALRGGWQRRGGSLAHQLDFARAKIWCHANYLAALSGSGGCKTSAPWREFEKVMGWTLRAIAGLPGANVKALQIESGVWDLAATLDMLLLRMHFKFLTMPSDCAYRRAMALSAAVTQPIAKSQPLTAFSSVDQLQRQTWMQMLLAAAERFEVKLNDPNLVTVQVLRGNAWCAPPPLSVIAHDECVRLVLSPTPDGAERTEGVDCWALPDGTSLASALGIWTTPLRDATYAALRRRGNVFRHKAVREFLVEQATDSTRLKNWAATLSCSLMQPYWHLDDPTLARWLLKSRLDECPVEDFARIAVHHGVPRIADHRLRACPLCDAIDPAAPTAFWPETLTHALLYCTHARPHNYRTVLRTTLARFASEPSVRALTGGVAAPDFTNDSALLTVLQMCTGIGANAVLQSAQVPPLLRGNAVAHAEARRNLPQFCRNMAVARATTVWIRCLTDDWCDILRQPRRNESHQQSPGYRLAHLMARHTKRVFDVRKTLLSTPPLAHQFQQRLRNADEHRPSKSRNAPAAALLPNSHTPAAARGNAIALAAPPRSYRMPVLAVDAPDLTVGTYEQFFSSTTIRRGQLTALHSTRLPQSDDQQLTQPAVPPQGCFVA